MIRYDIHKGVQKIKTKTFIAISTLGLLLGSGGASLAVLGTAHAVTPIWNVSGSYQINVEYQSVNYPETLNLTQTGTNITGGDLNTVPPAASSAFTVTGGSVSGNNIDIYATQDIGTLAVHFSGVIAPTGSMSGNWGDVSPGTRTGIWTTTSGVATATSIKDFDADKNLRSRDCSLTRGSKEVVDVKFKLVNDYDSAVHGNAWANDTINRELNIWNVSGSTYCAIVQDMGSIVTFAGDSPNGTGTVGAGIKGQMDGGYRTTVFTGTFLGNTSPYARHGNLGTYDLMCTDANTCPGTHPVYSDYFGTTSGDDLAWWGWEYNTCQNGNWVNSIEANTGDITGTTPLNQNKERCSADNDSHHHDNDKHHDNREHVFVGPRQ